MPTETRTHATPLFPGSLLPEEGASELVEPGTSDAEIVARFAENPNWFCIELTTRPFEKWTNEEGAVRWLPIRSARVERRRIYIGDVFDLDSLAVEPGDHRILRSNMRSNGWDRVVRTRAGNWQPVEADDVVLAGV